MDSEDKEILAANLRRLTKALAQIDETMLSTATQIQQIREHLAAHPEHGEELLPILTTAVTTAEEAQRMVEKRVEVILCEFQAVCATFRDDN